MNAALELQPPPGISAQEWRVRCDLAATYRLVAHFGMTDVIYTHISARLPGAGHQFLINEYGVQFHEMRASDLVKIDVDGKIIEDDPRRAGRRINEAGFVIHSAVHMARPDVMCVIHTHTNAGTAVSAQKHGLLPISQHALVFYGKLGYHDYEGIALELGERERLVRDLGPHKAMILRNHGLLTCGKSFGEAFNAVYMLERACQAQVAALAGGAELNVPSREACERTALQASQLGDDHFAMFWKSCLRLIDSGTPDYRS